MAVSFVAVIVIAQAISYNYKFVHEKDIKLLTISYKK